MGNLIFKQEDTISLDKVWELKQALERFSLELRFHQINPTDRTYDLVSRQGEKVLNLVNELFTDYDIELNLNSQN